ncbi:O-antigen ligase family protein [Methylomonas sp. 11b]|uniref:O-antigen ligase family protein n=1 Tax=Methylomonas sp. 11b TaxID=1168169 RepID=UPI00047A3FF8|nr:O-antigen ligase family protein [Methylomonas sp. 11b]
MIEIAVCLILLVAVAFRPTVVPYFALLYLFTTGLASREFIDSFKVSLGPVNILPLDLFYALALLYCFQFFIKKITNPRFNSQNAPETKLTAIFILFFLIFFVGKLVNGYLNHMALDNVLRFFMGDTQVLYFFMPLVMYQNVGQLKSLIKFTILISLVFPLCQPLLIHSKLTQTILQGQGTLRLGFGDANILLAFGCIALFSWEYKKYLAFLPLSGIMMLAHRSGYIGIVLALFAVSFLKGKKVKTLIVMGVAGGLVIALLAILQSLTNVNLVEQNLNRAGETFKSTGTTAGRASVIPLAFEELQKRPFTGLEYKEIRDKLILSEYNARDFNIVHPHNFVLSAIMSYGLIGTILLAVLLIRSMRTAYKLAKTERFKSEGAFLFSSILFFVIFSTMNTTMGTVGYALWFVCGVTFWFHNQLKMEN